jgi:hypothetical protein
VNSTIVAVVHSRIAAILAPGYLDGLTSVTIEEIRARRGTCQAVEVSLSYLRRLVQGRLDIVLAEVRRRDEGAPEEDLHSLVERLPEILSDHVHAPGNGRLSTFMAPGDTDLDRELLGQLDDIVDAERLATLPSLSEDQVRSLVDQLTTLERSVSGQRRALHERIDALQEELVRRYRTGEANVDSLLS